MSDLKSKLDSVKSKESFLEKIKRFIPGYKGYVTRDNAREIDTLLRNQLAQKLEVNKKKIANAVSNLSNIEKLFETQDIHKIDKKNETAIAKFKSAARGYSGAFDVNKIKDEKLEKLYEFDSGLLEEVENINNLFVELEKNSETGINISEIVKRISLELDELINKFEKREEILRNIE